jgi:hypothetical protein
MYAGSQEVGAEGEFSKETIPMNIHEKRTECGGEQYYLMTDVN